MRVAIIGTGYVGLVTGACLASLGHEVACLDRDAVKIARLRRGEIPIYEPGLEPLVRAQLRKRTLSFTTDAAAALRGADLAFITVGTPLRADGGSADVSQVVQAAREIAPFLSSHAAVVIKSTAPVGTARRISEEIGQLHPAASFDVVSNPEFLREGNAIHDFMSPERIVVGTRAGRASQRMRQLYQHFTDKGVPLLVTIPETAELIKYAANAFLATKITFINEIAGLCEACGADVGEVAYAMGLDSRIGDQFLKAGPGFGGSCFPKDTQTLVQTGHALGAPQRIVESVLAANRGIQERLAARVIAACGGTLGNKTVAVLGLAFKANTDDMRNAAALAIIPRLQAAGARIRAFDPVVGRQAEKLLPEVALADDLYAAAAGAEAAVILTECAEFAAIDLARLAAVMAVPRLVDFRNLYDPAAMADTPFHYVSLGRCEVRPDAAAKAGERGA